MNQDQIRDALWFLCLFESRLDLTQPYDKHIHDRLSAFIESLK
jgi:hypothetical protein